MGKIDDIWSWLVASLVSVIGFVGASIFKNIYDQMATMKEEIQGLKISLVQNYERDQSIQEITNLQLAQILENQKAMFNQLEQWRNDREDLFDANPELKKPKRTNNAI